MSDLIEDLKVWSNYEGKKKDGEMVKLRFMDLPVERREESILLYNEYMLKDEVIHRASGLCKSEEALQEYSTVLESLFQVIPPHVTMCCVEDGTKHGGKIVGVSLVSLVDNKSSFSEFMAMFDLKTKEMQMLMKASDIMEGSATIKEKYDHHYYGRGLVVHPEYRGMGIASEFVRLRKILCEEQNIPMTAAWMTAIGSKRAGEKNNWKVHTEIQPKKFSEQTGLNIPEDALPFKLMYTTKD